MNSVDEILVEYGMTREKAEQFVELSPAYNRKQAAAEIGMSEENAHRYRRAFQDMDEETRRQVIRELVSRSKESDSCPACGASGATEDGSSYPLYCLNDTCRVDTFRSSPEGDTQC